MLQIASSAPGSLLDGADPRFLVNTSGDGPRVAVIYPFLFSTNPIDPRLGNFPLVQVPAPFWIDVFWFAAVSARRFLSVSAGNRRGT